MALEKNVTFADQTVTLADGKAYPIGDLPQHALLYWFLYGLRQSTSDAIAGMAKELATAKKDEDGNVIRPAYTEAQIEAEMAKAKAERQASVLDGTIGTRGTGEPRATKRETVIKTVTQEWLKKAAEKAGMALPKHNSDEYKALSQTFGQKNEAAISAEADRRMGEPEVELSL